MLDTYIIEELKRRERERLQRERQRPTLEIPIQQPEEKTEEERRSEPDERSGNSVVHIDL
jgi:hypothetical protein